MHPTRVMWLSALVVSMLLLAGCGGTLKVNQGTDARGNFYRGSSNASVTIYEYTDFECPNCKLAETDGNNVISAYQDRGVRIVCRNVPLESIHPDARGAAVAAELDAKRAIREGAELAARL